MLAFCLLAAWSKGLLCIPPAALLLLDAFTSRRGNRKPTLTCGAFFIAFALLQFAAMIGAIQPQ